MQKIRPNVFFVTYSELGKPATKGVYDVPDLGAVGIDEADLRYIKEQVNRGHEPAFFVSHAPTLGGRMVVVARQRSA